MDRSVCWFCKHMYLDTGYPDWSELTPGDDMSMGCYKGKWSLDPYKDDLVAFRAKITTSVNCSDFEKRDA